MGLSHSIRPPAVQAPTPNSVIKMMSSIHHSTASQSPIVPQHPPSCNPGTHPEFRHWLPHCSVRLVCSAPPCPSAHCLLLIAYCLLVLGFCFSVICFLSLVI